jgi:hypothetical protein
MASPTTLRLLGAVELSSGGSERSRREPKCWLKFEDVVHCRDVESFNAFADQYLSERGLVGDNRMRTFGLWSTLGRVSDSERDSFVCSHSSSGFAY